MSEHITHLAHQVFLDKRQTTPQARIKKKKANLAIFIREWKHGFCLGTMNVCTEFHYNPSGLTLDAC